MRPTKAMVIEMPDGEWFEGDSYTELVARYAETFALDYLDAEPETQWQIRADMAAKWAFAAGVLGVELTGELEPESDESLLVTAAKAGWLILYDNEVADEL